MIKLSEILLLLAEFKSKLITSMRPVKNSLFGVFKICVVKKLTMFPLEFSALNEHSFRQSFQFISPMCACNTGIEDNSHFFLHYPLFDPIRYDLLGQLSYLPKLDLGNSDRLIIPTSSGVTEQCGALSQSSGSGPLFFANHVYRLRLPLTA